MVCGGAADSIVTGHWLCIDGGLVAAPSWAFCTIAAVSLCIVHCERRRASVTECWTLSSTQTQFGHRVQDEPCHLGDCCTAHNRWSFFDAICSRSAKPDNIECYQWPRENPSCNHSGSSTAAFYGADGAIIVDAITDGAIIGRQQTYAEQRRNGSTLSKTY
jgi:hypothetical protein